MPIEKDQLLADGRYRVVSFIARGGIAQVWRARDLETDEILALKILTPRSLRYPDVIQRFRLEYELLSRLDHPRIIRVHAFGEENVDNTTLPWFSMDYYPMNLRQRLASISINEGLRLLKPVIEALGYAHDHNICHRDLKPMNILMDNQENVVLSDFGIARQTDRDSTLTGKVIIGTPYYLSPEQCMGLPVSARSDLYALGVIMYQLCTSKLPFEGPSELKIIQAHINTAPRPIQQINPDVSDELAAIIDRCLSKQPEQRHESAHELADALHECPEMTESTERILQAGQTVLTGRYRVLGLIEQGGFAEVYRVQNIATGRVYALKILLPDQAVNRESWRRFKREINILKTFEHPNIIKVMDAGEHRYRNINLPLFVMRYYPGDLQRALAGPIDPEKALNVLMEVLEGLSYAHQFEGGGVLHRDLKPSNILIGSDGHAFLTDFGIARIGKGLSSLKTRSATMTRAAIGTTHYMSPEQIKNQPLDERSDLYAIGVILYEIVTQRKPFEAQSGEQIAAMHLYEQPEPPRRFNPSVSPRLQAVIMRALNKDRDKRYANIPELVQALEKARYNGRWFPEGGPIPTMRTRLLGLAAGTGRGVRRLAASAATWWLIFGVLAGAGLGLSGASGVRAIQGAGLPRATQLMSPSSFNYRSAFEPLGRLNALTAALGEASQERQPSEAPPDSDPPERALLGASSGATYDRLHQLRIAATEHGDPLTALAARRRMNDLLASARPRLRLAPGADQVFQSNQQTTTVQVPVHLEPRPPVDFQFHWQLLDGERVLTSGVSAQPLIEVDGVPVTSGEQTFELRIAAVRGEFTADRIAHSFRVVGVEREIRLARAGKGDQARLIFENFSPDRFARYRWQVTGPDGQPIPVDAEFANQPLPVAAIPAEGPVRVALLAHDADPALSQPYRSPAMDLFIDRTPPRVSLEVLEGARTFERKQRLLDDGAYVMWPEPAGQIIQLRLAASDNHPEAPGQTRLLAQAEDQWNALPDPLFEIRYDSQRSLFRFAAEDPAGNRSEPLELTLLRLSPRNAETLFAFDRLAREARRDQLPHAAALEPPAGLEGLTLGDLSSEQQWLRIHWNDEALFERLTRHATRLDDLMAADRTFSRLMAQIQDHLAQQGAGRAADLRQALARVQAQWRQADLPEDPRPEAFIRDHLAGQLAPVNPADLTYLKGEGGIENILSLPGEAGTLPGVKYAYRILYETPDDTSQDNLARLIEQGGQSGVSDIRAAIQPTRAHVLIVRPELEAGGSIGRVPGPVAFIRKGPTVRIPEALNQAATDYAELAGTISRSPERFPRALAWHRSAEHPYYQGVLEQPDSEWLIQHHEDPEAIERVRRAAETLRQYKRQDETFAEAKAALGDELTGWAAEHRSALLGDLEHQWLDFDREAPPTRAPAEWLLAQARGYAASHPVLPPPRKPAPQRFQWRSGRRLQIESEGFGTAPVPEARLMLQLLTDEDNTPSAGQAATIAFEQDRPVLMTAPGRGETFRLAARWHRPARDQWPELHSPWTVAPLPALVRPTPSPTTSPSPRPTVTSTPTPEPAGRVSEEEARDFAERLKNALYSNPNENVYKTADQLVENYCALSIWTPAHPDSAFITPYIEDSRARNEINRKAFGFWEVKYGGRVEAETFRYHIAYWSMGGATGYNTYELHLDRREGTVRIVKDRKLQP